MKTSYLSYLFIKAQFTSFLCEVLPSHARSQSPPHPLVLYNLLSEPLMWHLTSVALLTLYPPEAGGQEELKFKISLAIWKKTKGKEEEDLTATILRMSEDPPVLSI